MPQSDGRNTLKRMEFVYGNSISFKFTLNPEEYSMDEGTRSTVTQTKGGAWVDDFGKGLPTITIRGTTGMKKGGFAKFKEFRNFIRNYMEDGAFGSERKKELVFHNWTDGESWVVHIDPSGFRLTRSKSSPLLYTYDLKLICLRKANEANPNIDGVDIVEGAQVNSAGTTVKLTGASTYTKQLSQSQATQYKQTLKKNNEKILQSKMEDNSFKASSSSVKKTTSKTTSSFAPSLSVKNKYVVNSLFPGFNKKSGYLRTFADDYSLAELDFEFDNRVSTLADETYKRIINGEFHSFDMEANNDDFAIRLHKFMKGYTENWIKAVVGTCCLELFSIGISDVESDEFVTKMTKVDMKRLISNLAFTIDLLGELERPDWEFIRYFRMLQRCVMTIYNSHIYNTDIKESLDDIKKAQLVVGDE